MLIVKNSQKKKCVAIKILLGKKKDLKLGKKLYFWDIFIYEVWNETIFKTVRRKEVWFYLAA